MVIRAKWSPIQSVIIINEPLQNGRTMKQESNRLQTELQTELDNIMTYYQLIITISISPPKTITLHLFEKIAQV